MSPSPFGDEFGSGMRERRALQNVDARASRSGEEAVLGGVGTQVFRQRGVRPR
jgi:hypothetical protein